MTRTFVEGLLFAVALYGAAFGGVLVAHAHAAAPCDPADSARCCACEPVGAAEPAPLPHVYLPLVQHLPRMSSEYTPLQPAPTVTPDPPVMGDVQ